MDRPLLRQPAFDPHVYGIIEPVLHALAQTAVIAVVSLAGCRNHGGTMLDLGGASWCGCPGPVVSETRPTVPMDVRLLEPRSFLAELVDATGRSIIHERVDSTTDGNVTLSVHSDLPMGSYFVLISTQGETLREWRFTVANRGAGLLGWTGRLSRR